MCMGEADFGEMTFVCKAPPSKLFKDLQDLSRCKQWLAGGKCYGVEDVSDIFPDTGAQAAFMGKYDELTGTTVLMVEITDVKFQELIRMEYSLIYYSDDTSNKEACTARPSVKFRSDFNLFEAKNGGTEIIRHIQDFEQLSGLIPASLSVDAMVREENAALIAHFKH